jgi:hypothetical protein
VDLRLLSVLVWRAAFSAPDGRLHATLLDVGDGEALLIESLTGRFVLVQGGGARLEALAAGLCSGRTETAGLSCLRMASSCGWR